MEVLNMFNKEQLLAMNSTISRLEGVCSGVSDKSWTLFTSYDMWLMGMSRGLLSGVIIGCAKFRHSRSHSLIFSDDEEAKDLLKSDIEICDAYSDLAKKYFLIAEI